MPRMASSRASAPLLLLLLLLRIVGCAASPASQAQARPLGLDLARHSGPSLAAVPLPAPLAASQPSVVAGIIAPQWAVSGPGVQGGVGGWLCGFWAAAGSAYQGSRRRARRRRRTAGNAAVAEAAPEIADAEAPPQEVAPQGWRWVPDPGLAAAVAVVPQACGVTPVLLRAGHAGAGFVWQQQPQVNVFGLGAEQAGSTVILSPPHALQWPMEAAGPDADLAASVATGSASSSSSPMELPPFHEPSMQPPHGPSGPKWTAKDADLAVAELRGGDAAARARVLGRVVPAVWPMALSKHGCRVVQAAVDAAGAPERRRLAEAFQGRVWAALRSPHANHVLQRCVAVLPPDQVRFVLTELEGCACEAARHPFGCRLLERLLEHCSWSQTASLAREILCEIPDLCKHQYGNYVVQHLLEHGAPQHRRLVAEALLPEVRRLARHKVASYVIECALLHCAAEEKQALKQAMAMGPGELSRLSHSNYGSFVVKEMMKR